MVINQLGVIFFLGEQAIGDAQMVLRWVVFLVKQFMNVFQFVHFLLEYVSVISKLD